METSHLRIGNWRTAWVVERHSGLVLGARAPMAGCSVIALLPRNVGVKGVEGALVAIGQLCEGVTPATLQRSLSEETRSAPRWDHRRRRAAMVLVDGVVVVATRASVRVDRNGQLEIRQQAY